MKIVLFAGLWNRMFWVWVVGGFGEFRVAFSAWMASSVNDKGLGLEFGQGPPCFRLWLPSGLVNFVGLGMFQGLEGSGLRWRLAWLKMGVRGGSADFFQGSPCFMP